MSVIPYLSHGIGVPIDPLTGLPKKKKQAAPAPFTQQQIGSSLANNPLGTFGPSQNVNYTQGPVTVPGFTPDYKSLIQQALAPFQAQLGAEGVADENARNSQMIRALGQFGQQFDLGAANEAFGPEFVGEAGLGSVLPQANALAQQTTDAGMSFTARAKTAQEKAVQQIRDSLAARGLLRSGATGVALQEQQTAFDTGQYDARLQLQDFLTAVNQGYVQAQRQRQAQLEAASREEAARQAQLNPPVGSRVVNPGDPDYPVPPNVTQARTPHGENRPLPPGWIGNPEPLDIAAILGRTVKPKPLPPLPGGGGTINRFV